MVIATVAGGADRIFAICQTTPPPRAPHRRNYLNTLNLETNLWRHGAGRLPAAIWRRILIDIRRGVVIENIIVGLSLVHSNFLLHMENVEFQKCKKK
jgi:hypothetical protein